jgi:hypothetical protein
MELVVLFLLPIISTCFPLECNLYELAGVNGRLTYFCKVERVQDDSMITFKTEMNERDELFVTIRSLETERFPRNFDDNMKQLRSLTVEKGNIKHLEAQDFHQFPNMEVLSISNCPIDEINDPNLFESNHNHSG